MKVIKNKEFLRNAANYIDLMNTLGGGICQPFVNIEKRKKGAIIHVSVPSVNPEAFQVVLNQNRLTVFAGIKNNNGSPMQAPIFHQDFFLPPNVAYNDIKAVYNGNELQIRLPFFETGARQIEIEIEKDSENE